ncbi:guanylate kinase [Aggregatilinea lenta]|uniref:guanylate kinase n=1 Tax=Aggregatilinea lenta TaxID=913108 RepID=UPI000E5BF369|nr:guanylate kinase [Aggregatilinea lenta]
MPHDGIVFVLVGPSGAGKNTLMRRVQAQFDGLRQLATMTTRSMRPGEQQGREHWFVSHSEFEALIGQDALFEWQRVHMNDLYGTPRKTVNDAIATGHDLIADIEFLGAGKIQESYGDHAVFIFVTPSRLEILADRITQRGNITPEEVANRLERAKFEMTFAPRSDYLVINDEIEVATEQLARIVASERYRRRGQGSRDAVIPRDVFHTSVLPLIHDDGHLLARGHIGQYSIPCYDSEDAFQAPHDLLHERLLADLGQEVRIESHADDRFDFVAPNHVTIGFAGTDKELGFYYRCAPTAPLVPPAGWVWCALDTLSLPAPLGDLIAM